MNLDIGTTLLLLVVLMTPAVVVFSIVTYIRVRRGRFHRQRIKRSAK